MSNAHQEIEVKFYLGDLNGFITRLEAAGGEVVMPRIHEINLRFDTPDHRLSQAAQVLRLRLDREARLTFKGPGSIKDGARLRQELEFVVSDFDTARLFLEALNFQVTFLYEKYRATYALGEVLLMVDEMPFGSFVEIEGGDALRIQAATDQLGLAWEARILESYTMLFERVKASLGLALRDLSFENFTGIAVSAVDLGVQIADGV
jgi:adenylate cyclase class 2